MNMNNPKTVRNKLEAVSSAVVTYTKIIKRTAILRLSTAYIFSALSLYTFAQIGINTESPTATLSVKSVSATQPAIKSRNSDNTEMFKIVDNGYMSMGGASPVVKLDLRGSGNGEIGLGTTTLTAAAAKAGAIRYNSGIEYSDGVNWVRLTTLPTKAFVAARNSTGPFCKGRESTRLANWTTVIDATNSFNTTNGKFTAPRTGVYSISCTAMAENATSNVANPLRLELNLNVSSTTAAQVKSAIAVPITLGDPGINLTLVNKAFLYLLSGDSFFFSIWNGIPEGVNITTDSSYNTLTISEM